MGQVFRVVLFLVIALSGMSGALRAADAPDTEELTRMLNEFLAGATINDAAAHERFWADDLIYTSSAGQRFFNTGTFLRRGGTWQVVAWQATRIPAPNP